MTTATHAHLDIQNLDAVGAQLRLEWTDLAAILGVDQSTLWLWRRGESGPRPLAPSRLAQLGELREMLLQDDEVEGLTWVGRPLELVRALDSVYLDQARANLPAYVATTLRYSQLVGGRDNGRAACSFTTRISSGRQAAGLRTKGCGSGA